jgi:hypothetical protein
MKTQTYHTATSGYHLTIEHGREGDNMSENRPKINFKTAVDVDWKSEKEYWNEYQLKDGTTLKVKLVLRGVKRLPQHNPDGTPTYIINSANMVKVHNVDPKLIKIPEPDDGGMVT